MNKTWIYSKDYGGIVYTGLVFDFQNTPNRIYSILSNYKVDSVTIKNNNVIKGNDTIAKILWKSNNCMIAEYAWDTIALHRIPDINNKESFELVKSFLLENAIYYKDNNFNLRIHYDTINLGNGFKQLKYQVLDYDHKFLVSSWNLKIVNNSLVLFNVDPVSIFHDNLLIKSITMDSIIADKLRFPSKNTKEFVKLKRRIENKLPYNFDYESFTLKKLKKITNKEKNDLYNILCSKEWYAKKIDTTNTNQIGNLFLNSDNRFYPIDSFYFAYNFYYNDSFVLKINDNIHYGHYKLSQDGKFIELNDATRFDDYIEISEIAKNKLIINQFVKVLKIGRNYDIYTFRIEFE